MNKAFVKVGLAMAFWLACAWRADAAPAEAIAPPPAAQADPADGIAIVAIDTVSLRAAPRDSAPQQAVLWQGETLEVRGERFGYLQVYDHRRERGGYVRATSVRRVALAPQAAPALLAVVRFLRDDSGSESLGLAYVAAYLKAAPGNQIGSEAFAALGTMADRLARHASVRRGDDAALSAHLDVAAGLGIAIAGVENGGQVQLCYDGEAWRRVLAMSQDARERADAALSLTRPECVDPNLTPLLRYQLDVWRSDVLARARREGLPDFLRNRLRLRNAGVQASLAYQKARRGEDARDTMQLALAELAGVDKLELAEDDQAAYSEAAVRVGASRWAAEAAALGKSGLSVETRTGKPGETCIALVDAKHPVAAPLAQRCTYGVVWAASASANAAGTALALAVQPLEGWRELWLFQKVDDSWRIDAVPPSLDNPELGYLEFAGWVPGKRELLAAREVKADGRYRRSFEILDLDTLAVEHQVFDRPASLTTFYRWQDAAWKRQSVALR